MTGHQQNPATGMTLKNEPTHKMCIEAVVEALGVKDIKIIDPNEIKELEAAIKDSLSKDEVSVIITRRPCVLLKSVKKDTYFTVNNDKCKSCKACMKIGCPAISMKDGKAVIDTTLCTGCDLCSKMCPFGAIEENKR
jgi:indolepyruvate ferredoxin oxidoreductase alpha subunit